MNANVSRQKTKHPSSYPSAPNQALNDAGNNMSFPPVKDTIDDVGLPSPTSSSGVPDEAPVYVVPSRVIAAVEHPLVIKNVDKAIQTFGRNCSYQTVCRRLDGNRKIILGMLTI